MPARLTLVCHGATEATRKSRFPLDEPLEAVEKERAAALAGRLRRADLVLTAPALRARETAAAFSPDAAVDAGLRDCDHGRWAGRSIEDLQAGDPDGLAAWITDPAAAPHGGESIAALCGRVAAWLEQSRDRSGHVVAITHASVIRAAILGVLQASAASFWRIDIEPLGVVGLQGDGRRWCLRASARDLLA